MVAAKVLKVAKTQFEKIKSLPRVLDILFRCISYQDKLQIRLVCKQLLEIANSASSFTVTLNDKIPELYHIPQLPIRTCIIYHLLSSEWGLTTLQFPTKLRKLVISGPTSFSNFMFLQDLDLENLRELVIQTDQVKEDRKRDDGRMVKRQTSLGLGICFPNLKSLSITGPSATNESILSRNIFSLILEANFQRLKKLKVQVECDGGDQSSHLALILRFLARHCSDLKDVSVIMTEDPLLDPSEWKGIAVALAPVHLFRLRQDQLKALQLKRLLLSPVASGVGGPEWAKFLYNQTRLETLESHLHLCPISFYAYVLKRNWHCLKEVTLLHLSCWESPEHFQPLDLLVFHNCVSLENITLVRYLHDETPEALCPTVPDLIGAQTLPMSLKKLSLSGFRMLPDEFYGIGLGLAKLESLTLMGCGHTGYFGVSGTCLEELLTHLVQLKTFCVVQLNTKLAGEEVKLKGIIAKVNQALGNGVPDSGSISNAEECKLDWSFSLRNKNPFCPSRPKVSFNLQPTYFSYKHATSNSTMKSLL